MEDGSALDISNTQVWRGTINLQGKTGAFDVSDETFKFPSLTDTYVEPVTLEQYENYYEYLRPKKVSGSYPHPGGWALDLSGIDGSDSDSARNLDRNATIKIGRAHV